VVADPMWGVGQGWFPRILGGGKTQLNEIHGHRNPVFPEMQRPEPIVENLQTLLRTVPEWNAAAGVAFDGDADRVGFVSEQGVFINQLQVYALLAYYLLDVRGQRGPLVRTVSTTVMANKLAARYGVDVYETGVGFKYVAPEMIRVDALIGGEESGGFAFRGHMPERDGLLAGLYLLDLMVQTGLSPSGLLERIFELVGAHYYDRIDRRMTPEQRPEVLARVAAARPDSLAGLKVNEIDDRDGYRYVLEDGGWMLVRFSGTEPVIRVYCETTHEDKVQDLLAEGLALAGLSA
jgi:phosphomannomutase